ncbi:MAG: LCP family protein [Actinomycetota bacterium]
MRRRFAVLMLALTAWVGGTVAAGIGTGGAAVAQTPGIIIGKAHAGYTPSLTGNKPVVVLAIGSGARPGDDVVHSLSDSLHVIFINPATHKASMVGIPRDSWVNIPAHGSDKINAAMPYGGPPLLIKTIETNWGVHIDYYALTTFWGIRKIVDSVGGLTIDVPFPMNDPYSHANFHPGVQKLTGTDVLAFSRDRHSLLSGDFGRSEDGGRVLVALLAQFHKQFTKDPTSLYTWVGTGLQNVSTDLSLDEVMNLGWTCTHVSAATVQNMVLPGGTGMQGSLSVVFIDTSRAKVIFADAQKDAVVARKHVPPSPAPG